MFKIIKFIAFFALLMVIGQTWGMDVNPMDELRRALNRNDIQEINELIDSGRFSQKYQGQLQELFAEFSGLGNYGRLNEDEEAKALEKMNAKKLRTLLASNARKYIDVNKTNAYGNSAIMAPIYLATLFSACAVLEFVGSIAECFQAKRGQRLKEKDVLEMAHAQKDMLAVIDLLLAAGADVNIVNIKGDSPLKLLEELLGNEDPRVRKLKAAQEELVLQRKALDKDLITAAKAGNYDQVKELLTRGANVNAKVYNNEAEEEPLYSQFISREKTALSYAISRGDLPMCRLLIEYGANVNANLGPLYRNPLELAAWKNQGQICQLLIEHGATVTWKALEMAISLNNVNNENLIRAILGSIPPENQKQLLKMVSTGLLTIQKAEPTLPNEIQRLIGHQLINLLINDWVALSLERIKQNTSRALGQRDFNFWEQMRKDLRNNAMRVLFGAPRGFWTGSMETNKEEKMIRKTTKDIYKNEKETYLGEADQSYYRILGVPVDATIEQINEAFEQRIQPYLHETYQTGISPEHKQLTDAWMTLIDPERRQAYDQSLTVRE